MLETQTKVVGAGGVDRLGVEAVEDSGVGGHSVMTSGGDTTTLGVEDAWAETDEDATSSQAAGMDEDAAGTDADADTGTSVKESSSVVGALGWGTIGSAGALDWGVAVELSAPSPAIEVVGAGGSEGDELGSSGSEATEEIDEAFPAAWEVGLGGVTTSVVGSGSGSTTAGRVVGVGVVKTGVIVVDGVPGSVVAAALDSQMVTVTAVGCGALLSFSCSLFWPGLPSTGTMEIMVVGLCVV